MHHRLFPAPDAVRLFRAPPCQGRRLLAVTVTLLALSAPGWARSGGDKDDGKGLLTVTKPAFGLVDGMLFAGEGTGRLDGTGSLAVVSQPGPVAAGSPTPPPIACRGRFEHDFRTGKGHLACDNGEEADFTFRFTGLTQGVGEGQSKAHGTLRFTFGLDPEQAARALGLPPDTHILASDPPGEAHGPPVYRLQTTGAPAHASAPPSAVPAGPLPSPASGQGTMVPTSVPGPVPASVRLPASSPSP